MSKMFTLGDFKPETSLEAICKKYMDKPNTDFTIEALKSELSTYAMSMLRDNPRADTVECDALVFQDINEDLLYPNHIHVVSPKAQEENSENKPIEENRVDSTGDYAIKPATDGTY